ncbi:MAG TPA: peptidoglycan-associated lipoprotein Pal [Candidatus Acidoferrales bacterium]|nr:peptidoglycan-associated lipoprotein Pal [Candidatus Acidoferrales bacterium]
MKMTKLAYPLALGLIVTVSATGCWNHRPYRVTPIPPGQSAQVGELPPGGTMSGGQPAGGGQTASLENFKGMPEDRAALAAYTIHFAFDSAVIRSSERANLQAVASALNSNSSDKLLIEGNCDERGTEEYNRALGERRALAARQALQRLGVDPSRVRTISYGKDRPVDSGHDESAWAKNRRDDFILLHPGSGV